MIAGSGSAMCPREDEAQRAYVGMGQPMEHALRSCSLALAIGETGALSCA
jgi:hypothetical protein